MAKSSIGSLLINLELQTATLNKQVKQIDSKFTKMGNTFKKVGVALAGAFAVRGFTSMLNNTLQLNDALGKTADRLGVTATELQQLHYSAEQSGVSVPTLEMALQRMTRRISEAGIGTGSAVKALQEMNIEADKLAKMGVHEQLHVLADALAGVESEADQVRLAMKLFDSEGVKLLNMLKDGSDGLKEYARQADNLGFIIDREMIAQMERANDSMNRLSKVGDGLKNTLTTALAPAITTVAEEFIEWVTDGGTAIDMLGKLHGAIKSVLQAIDVLNQSIRLSARGWGLLGDVVNVVAEGFFGSAESVAEANRKLEQNARSANKEFEKMVKAFDGAGTLAGGFEENLKNLDNTVTKTTSNLTNLNKKVHETGNVAKKTTEKLSDQARAIQHVFTNSFRNFEDSIVNFAKSGKLAFKDFAESILEDLLRMIIQLQITIPLMQSLKATMGAGGGLAGLFGFAQGGAIQNGVQAFAKGGIVNSPTLFPMANGMGLMGEAGAEAILPLTRTSGGDLGVKAESAGGTIVNIYNQSNADAEVTESESPDGQKVIDVMIRASVERSIGTGALDGAFNQNYGITRRGY